MLSSCLRLTRNGALAAAAVLIVAAHAGAQVRETPVTFDSAGRVPTITTSLAERLQLGAPAWPVEGQFVLALLYKVTDGTYVLAVERPSRVVDRYALTADQASELRAAIQHPLDSGRRAGIGEQTDIASEPAGSAFVRNQALLGLIIYGPAAAGAVATDPATASGTELLIAGGTFFAAMARRQADPAITTAQNNLSTIAALDGAALGGAVAYVAGVNDGHAASGAVLLGSLGGTVAGLRFGSGMTDAEAAASSFSGNALAATSLGVMGAAGALRSHGDAKAQVALASAAMVTGFAIGPSYPRRASYTVTAGDVKALTYSSALGIFVGAAPLVGRPHSDQTWSTALTAGFLGGMIVGDRLLVKPYDHTRSEATLLVGGMSAGALIGGGVAAVASAKEQTAWALATGGAVLGAAATEAFFRSSSRSVSYLTPVHTQGGERRVGVSINTMGLAFAAGRRPGRFSLVRVTF